jgi:hypothetical protein
MGDPVDIKWTSSQSIKDVVSIKLYRGGVYYKTLVDETTNTGVYRWEMSSSMDIADDYTIAIRRITAMVSDADVGISGTFSILYDVPTTTTTTTLARVMGNTLAVKYIEYAQQIVVFLNAGFYGVFNLITNEFKGIFNFSQSNLTCLAVDDRIIRGFDVQDSVRIIVGSVPNASDKWDSGTIKTGLNAMYYGGGNNLESGKRYYVNIMVYSNVYGWGSTQNCEFIMPR